MPFDRTSPLAQSPVTVGVSDYDAPDPSFLDTLGAAYRQENLIGSALSNARMTADQRDLYKVDPNYNVYQDPDVAEFVREDPDRWDEVYNKTAADAMRSNIEKERRDRDTLAASGWTGVGLSMAAAVTDPTILLPGGALTRAGKVGFSTLRSATALGGAAALGTAAQESILQGTQEIRPMSESALAVGGSAILGGVIGAAASKFFNKVEWDRVSKSLETDLADEVPNPAEVTDIIVSRIQSAGAAAVDDIKLDDLGIGGPKAAEVIARATAAARLNPGIQTMFSPSVKVREIYTRMVDNPIYTTMNMEGRSLGADVENSVKVYERGAVGTWLRNSRQLYREARKAGYTGTRTEFYQAVARAGRRGDVDLDGDIFVTRAAHEARRLVFDPLLERAKALKLLPDDVKTTTATSYVTRLWNRQKLIGEEDRFRDIASRYFREAIAALPPSKGPDFVSEADMEGYIEDVVTSVFNNLTGRGKGDIPEWLVPVKRGPLKERTFNIRDELVEEFLENDMELILRRYSRTMAAEVELAEKFGRADMKDQLEEIARDYTELRKKAKTPKERAKLAAAEARDIKNLTAFRDMIRGTYRASDEGSEWSKITRAALTWNYIRLLGGVTMASLTDAARLVGVHGVRATMREALPGLVKGIKPAKINRADAKALGAVTERVLQSRLASLADLQDPYRYGSKFERYLSNTSNLFTKATGLGWWNDTMKTMASVMTQNRMMRNALNYAGADAREKAYMAYLGIDEDMAQRIAGQFRKHGIEEDGIYGANVGDWDDDLAARAWGAALNKDVDRTIITKGVADTPLWMKSNWGKLIMQFKSFGMASHQRVLIAGLQERPHRLAEQMVFSTAIGMMISYLKYAERGDMDEADRLVNNPGLWIANGLDRTGILSSAFEISNTVEKLGLPVGIMSGAQALAGDEDRGGSASRYASRNKLGAVLGPSAGLFEDLATIAQQLGEGDLKKSGANAVIRQLPGATLPGVRSAIHMGLKPAFADAVN
ncbi:hypothetical protein CN140_01190 [Sinorhizobium meliloti]|uniref:hypothetical protein n=1 Tax=Rhizobium meliloti TaxID=382 RepID=UPI000FDC046E|nr:hypothetical protein [Sinorhizobium meliloti]RVL87578.1 hypothetical protein CN140_01190 [Sinorhizobium meliloti]